MIVERAEFKTCHHKLIYSKDLFQATNLWRTVYINMLYIGYGMYMNVHITSLQMVNTLGVLTEAMFYHRCWAMFGLVFKTKHIYAYTFFDKVGAAVKWYSKNITSCFFLMAGYEFGKLWSLLFDGNLMIIECWKFVNYENVWIV